jgi:hypothetical protein
MLDVRSHGPRTQQAPPLTLLQDLDEQVVFLRSRGETREQRQAWAAEMTT